MNFKEIYDNIKKGTLIIRSNNAPSMTIDREHQASLVSQMKLLIERFKYRIDFILQGIDLDRLDTLNKELLRNPPRHVNCRCTIL